MIDPYTSIHPSIYTGTKELKGEGQGLSLLRYVTIDYGTNGIQVGRSGRFSWDINYCHYYSIVHFSYIF